MTSHGVGVSGPGYPGHIRSSSIINDGTTGRTTRTPKKRQLSARAVVLAFAWAYEIVLLWLLLHTTAAGSAAAARMMSFNVVDTISTDALLSQRKKRRWSAPSLSSSSPPPPSRAHVSGGARGALARLWGAAALGALPAERSYATEVPGGGTELSRSSQMEISDSRGSELDTRQDRKRAVAIRDRARPRAVSRAPGESTMTEIFPIHPPPPLPAPPHRRAVSRGRTRSPRRGHDAGGGRARVRLVGGGTRGAARRHLRAGAPAPLGP